VRRIVVKLADESSVTRNYCRIFSIHTSRMQLSDDVNLEDFVTAKDELSGADIKVEDDDEWLERT
jgi:ATP-dependent 26S proteasome regulatory subunit